MIHPALAHKALTASNPKPIQSEIAIPISLEHWSRLLPTVTAPDFMTPFQDPSTQATDVIGGNHLDVISGSPEFRFSTELGLYTLRCNGSSESLRMTSTTFGDSDAATSISLLAFVSLENPGGSRAIVNKRGAVGYEVRVDVGGVGLLAALSDGTTTPTAQLANDHRGRRFPLILVIDRSGDTMVLETDLGSDSRDIAAVGSAATPEAFGVGSFSGLVLTDAIFHLAALWTGHALTAAERAALVAHFS